MDNHLQAGAAIFNAGYHHAAHDAWEDRWLDLDNGEDERLLHGLIQYTAAVHHGDTGNWEGVTGLATSATTYLDDLPSPYRGVALDPIRAYLEAVATDPELIERRHPPRILIDDSAPTFDTLPPEAAFIAAPLVAETLDYDVTPIERAIDYARTDLKSGDDHTEFLSLLLAFLSDADNRPTVYDRLQRHVDRRQTKEQDVEDLF